MHTANTVVAICHDVSGGAHNDGPLPRNSGGQGNYAACFRHMPFQAAASRDAFLKAAGHTAQGSQSLRVCEEQALAKSLREGEDLSSVLEEQRWVEFQCTLQTQTAYTTVDNHCVFVTGREGNSTSGLAIIFGGHWIF